jgi:hypothetical protein
MHTMSITPITATTIKRTLDAFENNTVPTPIITFGPPSKPAKGCIFYNTTINTLSTSGAVTPNHGFFTFSNTVINSGPAKKGDLTDKRNREGQEYKANIGIALADLGVFGEQWKRLNDYWVGEVEKQNAAGKIKLFKREIHALYYKTYGTAHATNPGEEVPNPMITLKVSAGTSFSERHPIAALRGKKQVNILDGRKPIYNDAQKVIGYEPFIYLNEAGEPEQISNDNIDRVLTSGTTVNHAVFMCTGAAAASSTFSMPWALYSIVITPPELHIPLFGDDDEAAPSNSTTPAPTTTPEGSGDGSESEDA